MPADLPRKLHVQKDRDKVSVMTEQKVRNALKEGDLSGLELVRYDGQDAWVALHDLPLFREVVPFVGDPRDTARRREVRGALGHASGFAITSLILLITTGGIPWWLGIWGIFLALHVMKVAPTALALRAEGKPILSDEAPTGGALAPPPRSRTSAEKAEPLEQEAQRVRELILAVKPDDERTLLRIVDELKAAILDAEGQERDLEAQVSDDERAQVRAELEEAQAQLDAAAPGDRAVFEAHVAAVRSRQTSMDDAVRARAHLLARKSVAMNQLKQLRLDLSRARADDRTLPDGTLKDVGRRLEDIRLQMAAAREVDQLLSAQPAGEVAPEAGREAQPADPSEQQLEEVEENVVAR